MPLSGAQNVPTASPIQVNIQCDNLPLDHSRFSIQLSNSGKPVAGNSQWPDGPAGGQDVLRFVPTLPLAVATTYTVKVVDNAGSGYSWQFTTRDGNWTKPTHVGQLLYGGDASIAVSPGGKGIIALASRNGEAILAVRFDMSTGISTTVDTVKASTIASLHYVHAGINDSNQAWVAWIDYGTGGYVFSTADSQAEGSWTVASAPAYNGSLEAIYALGVRNDGSKLIARSTNDLLAQSADPPAQPFVVATGPILDADAALFPDGGAAFVWQDGGQGVSLRMQDSSGAWQAAQVVSAMRSGYPRVSVGRDGSVWTSWEQSAPPSSGDGMVRRYVPGHGFDAAFKLDMKDTVDRKSFTESYRVLTASDQLGDGLALWLEGITYQPTGSNIYATDFELRSQRFADGSWASAHVLLDGHASNISARPLALAAQGNGFAMWSCGALVCASRFYPASGWQSTTRLLDSSASIAPAVAADASGRAAAVWWSGDQIYAALFTD
jgi:hypothetical protein